MTSAATSNAELGHGPVATHPNTPHSSYIVSPSSKDAIWSAQNSSNWNVSAEPATNLFAFFWQQLVLRWRTVIRTRALLTTATKICDLLRFWFYNRKQPIQLAIITDWPAVLLLIKICTMIKQTSTIPKHMLPAFYTWRTATHACSGCDEPARRQRPLTQMTRPQ